MRRAVILLPLALAACGQAQHEAGGDGAATEASDAAGPGVAVTAGPGVAFDYRYSFRLPAAAVARTQEAHAQACERLGVARCRIAGMRYQVRGENDVAAQLALKLDPAVARAFGKQGVDLVAAANGKLLDAEITGTDAGSEVARLSGERARAADELRRLDAQLARPGLSAAERAALQDQRAGIARLLAAADDGAAAGRASLAATPMTFDYASGPAIRGFDAGAPLASALDTAAGSAQVTLAVVLGALALLGPPGLVLALAWLLWRRFGRRLRDQAATA